MVRKTILGGGKDQILKCFACQAKELKVSIGNGASVKSFKKKEVWSMCTLEKSLWQLCERWIRKG